MKKHLLAIIMALAMPLNASITIFNIAQSKRMKVVYTMGEFLESTYDLYYNGEVDYGDRVEYRWNGYRPNPNTTFRLRYRQMFIKKAVGKIEISTPNNIDLKNWRY